ncbi:MAG: hypothetical protein JXB35_09535 [Anaerolineae bacterium]|nr:hypothetical protein [Anaerolineae bacterium]
MELRNMFRIVRQWWWLVAIPVVIVGVYTLLTLDHPAPQYQVVMRFAAGTEPAGLSIDYDRYYPWLASEYVARGLAEVAESGSFAGAVSERLVTQGLDVAASAIQGRIISDYLQSVFVIYITWQNADQIVPLAEAVTLELTQNAAAYYPQIKDVGIAARRLDAPNPMQLSPSLRAQLLSPSLKLAVALAAGLGLAFLAHYLDPSVREPADLKDTGLPILGRIPR